MSTKPIRGQRRRGVPSLVLPGDLDGCGFERERGQSSAEVPRYWLAGEWYDADEPDAVPLTVRYVGSPTRWGNPFQAVKRDGRWMVTLSAQIEGDVPAVEMDATEHEVMGAAVRAFKLQLDMGTPIDQASYVAPLVTADVLSCWCPLDAPCHGDTLCDLVGRLRSGDLVPGLVATPDVCGGALRIDGYDVYTVSELADEVRDVATYGHWTADEAIENIASDEGVDVELVRLAARVGGAL